MPTTNPAPDVLSIEEYAERFAVSVRTVRRAVRSGEVPAFRVGAQWRIPRAFADAQVAEAMAAHEAAAAMSSDLPGLTA